MVLLVGTLAACSSDDDAASDAATTAVSVTATPVTDVPATDVPATEPAATEPAATEPAATEPAATEPAATEPAATEPAATEPAATEPAATEPAATTDGPDATVGTDSTAEVGTEERPATLYLPSGYDPDVPGPLVVLLHGYGHNGDEQDAYFAMRAEADARGYLYVHPDGTVDGVGNQFWNATDACCNFTGSGVDDSGYLADLITEVADGWSVDPGRVSVVGHSNGGFMSYRMACDHADLVAAIVSLAGATFDDPAACAPSEPVSVAQVHGTSDEVVGYEGGVLFGDPTFPSAPETVGTWAAYDGCGDWLLATTGAPLDVDVGLAGAETSVSVAVDCPAGVSVELWTIDGGRHVPALGPGFVTAVFDFLDAHARS